MRYHRPACFHTPGFYFLEPMVLIAPADTTELLRRLAVLPDTAWTSFKQHLETLLRLPPPPAPTTKPPARAAD